jgi:hypothetical protein
MIALRTGLPARIASRVCWLKPAARINARTPAAATREGLGAAAKRPRRRNQQGQNYQRATPADSPNGTIVRGSVPTSDSMLHDVSPNVE